jgi:hypothetical protein
MSVPETSVNEDDLAAPWEDEVGFSRKVFSIDAVCDSES